MGIGCGNGASTTPKDAALPLDVPSAAGGTVGTSGEVGSGGAGAGGEVGSGGAGTGGLVAGGGSSVGGAGGSGSTRGSAIDCSVVGCSPAPMCATGCTASCGCCRCADGTWQGNLVCHGGCWEVSDARADAGSGADSFESFRLTQSFGPCRPESDCVGYIDLDKTGRLLRDDFSGADALGGPAHVTPAELAGAIAVFTDPALVQLLDASSPPCVPPHDIFERMTLVTGGVSHENGTTMCDNAPVKAARDLIYQLGDKYLPLPTR